MDNRLCDYYFLLELVKKLLIRKLVFLQNMYYYFYFLKKKQTTSPSPKTNEQTPLSLNMEKIGFPEGENTHAVPIRMHYLRRHYLLLPSSSTLCVPLFFFFLHGITTFSNYTRSEDFVLQPSYYAHIFQQKYN